jgi:hypothetical protein
MKTLKFKFIAIAIFIATFGNAQQIAVGITMNNHEDFKSGLSVSVQGSIISLNKSFAVIYDMQYKSLKSFDDYINVSGNYKSTNIGLGLNYNYERKSEISLKGGVSLNNVPSFTDNSSPDSFTMYEFDNTTGTYFGATFQYNIWLSEKIATFVQYQANYNIFSPDYSTKYWDENDNMELDNWIINYIFFEQTFSVGLKIEL